MTFRATPIRFEFEATDEVWFPRGKAGNTFRGALGMVLSESIFSPRSEGSGPAGLRNQPRPFALRVSHLDGRRIMPGARFEAAVNLFDGSLPQAFIAAFERLSRLGPQRSQVKLMNTIQGDEIAIDLSKHSHAGAAHIQFLTPTELKFEAGILREPRFDALFARIRDRVGYFCGEHEVDFRGLGERSRAVAMTSSKIEQTETERRSSRTGQRHPLGGFTGEAEYRGALGEFEPWLKAAEWTGAGRHTAWGNGQLVVAGIVRDGIPLESDARRR